jgi:hypothetical protein
MSKTDKYSSKQTADNFEILADKLTADLRRSIRQLENYPILSDSWLEMTETFGRVANIADMESKLSSAKNEDSTLWETEEQALRFMLEDGKMNLCLKSLVEFKTAQISARSTKTGVMLNFPRECDKFEKGLGSILRNAWQHVEVLQTTDLPALVNHIADVLVAANQMPDMIDSYIREGDLHQRQEMMVFHYMNGLFGHIEDIKEHRVMPVIRERRVFMLGVEALCNYCEDKGGEQLMQVHKIKAAQALSLLVETDDFCTYKDQHYNSSDIDTLVRLKDDCLTSISKDYEVKRSIRPLIDCIDKAKRLLSIRK